MVNSYFRLQTIAGGVAPWEVFPFDLNHEQSAMRAWAGLLAAEAAYHRASHARARLVVWVLPAMTGPWTIVDVARVGHVKPGFEWSSVEGCVPPKLKIVRQTPRMGVCRSTESQPAHL